MESALIGWLFITSGLYLGYCSYSNRKPINSALNWAHERITGHPGALPDHNDNSFGADTIEAQSVTAAGMAGLQAILPYINGGGTSLPTTGGTAGGVPANSQAAEAVAFAQSKIGEDYGWGGTGPYIWDCSGLSQGAYGSAGVRLPRVATDQYHATKSASCSADVPGALVFYGNAGFCHHVGISIGNGQMIDAPHTGAKVRVEAQASGGETPFAATFPPAVSALNTRPQTAGAAA